MKVGEILEASTAEFLVECYDLYGAPPFGSLVRTKSGNVDIFAVVENTITGSREPGRLPVALGKAEDTEEAVHRVHPQLAKLLRTCFKALVIGYREGPTTRHSLPANPAHIHGFVFQCTKDEVREFSRSHDFLPLIAAARTDSPQEELIAACLKQMSLTQENPRDFLVAAGKELTLLFRGDISKLNYVLRRIRV